MKERKYWKEVRSIADAAIAAAIDNDSSATEEVDRIVDHHSWVIYTVKAMEVVRISPNHNEIFELGKQEVESFETLWSSAAYFALRQDACEDLDDAAQRALSAAGDKAIFIPDSGRGRYIIDAVLAIIAALGTDDGADGRISSAATNDRLWLERVRAAEKAGLDTMIGLDGEEHGVADILDGLWAGLDENELIALDDSGQVFVFANSNDAARFSAVLRLMEDGF